MDDIRPGYYAVIPADIRYDDRIPANAKLLYGEISALIGAEGYCFASNAYFASLYKLSERTVSGLIAKLQESKYIDVVLEKDPKTGQVKKRLLYLKVSSCDERPLEEIFYTPRKYFREGIEKIFQDTNTSNTVYVKESKKEKPKREKSEPLTDAQLHDLFYNWIDGIADPDWTRQAKNELYFALEGFYAPRPRKKQEPARSPAAFTALTNRLARYSMDNGRRSPSIMLDMLERATTAGWKSVFPLNGTTVQAGEAGEGKEDVICLN